MKKLLKNWLPPIVQDHLRRIKYSQITYAGSYNSWACALECCQGYNDPLILEKVLAATLKVKNGEAAFERDSILFEEPEYQWPIVAALLLSAARNEGTLNVMDFGGSLGSKYFQHRELLLSLDELHWNIVEQPSFVVCGKEHIEDENIRFHNSIAESQSEIESNVILISGVLQYIEDPEQLIEMFSGMSAKLLILDNTPMTDLDNHQLVVQQVPKNIYKTSYPAWLFSRKRLLDSLAPKWKVEVNLPTANQSFVSDTKTEISFDGMVLSRI